MQYTKHLLVCLRHIRGGDGDQPEKHFVTNFRFNNWSDELGDIIAPLRSQRRFWTAFEVRPLQIVLWPFPSLVDFDSCLLLLTLAHDREHRLRGLVFFGSDLTAPNRRERRYMAF